MTEGASERKLVTVLFADLVGSTQLGASQDPERTRAMLDRFYDAMAAEVERSGGTVEKFAGDAVMAAFGAPAAHEDHAERALHAALAMRHRLAELFGDELALRIGVNTGEVVVGRPREGSSFVTGDAVNVAARLEQAAEAGEILAGERTVAAARGAFEFGSATTVEAKGKEDGVACRRLVRALSLMRPRGVSGLGRAFVGRESEQTLLQATYDRVVGQGEPHLVTIMGDAGVGKTRLVRELWEWLAGAARQPRQRTGRCLPYGELTYWALGEVLKEHLWILESDAPEIALRRLEGREILGLALGLDVAGDLHPLAARDRLHEAWIEFLQELAREQPAVLLIEDLHWAEEPLLDLLERTVRDVHGPVLLIGTARPELLDRRPAWGGGRRNSTLLWLEPLTGEDSERLLQELLTNELPEELRTLLVERAEGNPFFVEEMIGALIDRGVLARRNGGWTVGVLPADLDVPDSVQAVLAARIDLLPAGEKAALQAGSVIGRVFWGGPVRELLDGAEPDFTVLEDRDFVRRRAGSSLAGEVEYAIKHQLTREVAYASLPKARRARLHARFAQWLERLGEGRDEHAPLLAHHYAEAVRPEDADLAWADAEEELAEVRAAAVRWLRRAAELAEGRYEIDEALAMLEHAVELETRDREQAELWRAIGHANALKYDGEAFWDAIHKAMEKTTDPATVGDLYAELAYETAIRSGMWRRRPGKELVDGWIERALAETDRDTPGRARALIALASWNPLAGREASLEATQVAEKLGDPELRSMAWGARGIVSFAHGEFDHGRAWAERRFEVVDELTDPDLRADIHAAPISGCIWSGRFREARRLGNVNDQLTSTLTPHHRVHGVAILGEVEELLGNWERIRELQERTEEAAAANLATPCVRNARSLLVCALASACLGDDEGSRRLEETAQEHWMEGYGPLLSTPRIKMALVRGDLALVEQLLDEPEPTRGWYKGWLSLVTRVARLDGLAVIGAADRVEEEAVPVLRPGKYPEPFALRALGIVREDESLLKRADERFRALRLDWHADQTESLRRFRNLATG
jgi:class 3 adenylate cyclase